MIWKLMIQTGLVILTLTVFNFLLSVISSKTDWAYIAMMAVLPLFYFAGKLSLKIYNWTFKNKQK